MTITNHLKQQKPDTKFQPGDKITNEAGVIVIVTRCLTVQAIGFVLHHPDYRFIGQTITVALTEDNPWVRVVNKVIFSSEYFCVGDLVSASVRGAVTELMVVDVSFDRSEYTCLDIRTADDYKLSGDLMQCIYRVVI